MKYTILLFVGLSFSLNALSQKKTILDAEELIFKQNILPASELLSELSNKSPDNPKILLRLGYCYLHMPNSYGKAIEVLKKAENKFRSHEKEVSAFDAKFQLARAYRKNLMLGDAIRTYNELIIESKIKDYEAVDILQREIKYCENAKTELNKDYIISVKNIGNTVNSKFSEHSPFLNRSNDMMFFTSKRNYSSEEQPTNKPYDENIFSTTKEGKHWSGPKHLQKPLNTQKNDANCGLSPDGKNLYIYRQGNIFLSQKEGDKWTDALPLKYVNSKEREVHLFINSDNTEIYFSSDRKGGLGGLDIYRMKKEGDKWSKPENPGPEINTPFDDDSPFLHEDGTLYFSSKGHNSIGGYDIFKAKISGNSFSKVQNMGVPVNSVSDDSHFYLSPDRSNCYFASLREGGFGRSDIYNIDYKDTTAAYLSVRGKIISDVEAPDIKVNVYNVGTMEFYRTLMPDTSGVFRINSLRGNDYYIETTSMGLYLHASTYSAPFDNVSEYKLNNIKLQKIKSGAVYRKYTLKFDDNSAEPLNETKLLLNSLIKFADKHSDLIFDICNGSGTDNSIQTQRISAIKNILSQNGFPNSKITENKSKTDSSIQEITIAVMDSKMVEYLETGKRPISKNTLQKKYGIQLGSYSQKLKNRERKFGILNSGISVIQSNDGLFKYTYGNYSSRTLAEDHLIMIQKMGFADAFIVDK
ncbi:MAG: hypothetical protein U9N85_07455 [Bacteroidota bacterium]|nr:hypothetical protein [Bacteroidota bacterium]